MEFLRNEKAFKRYRNKHEWTHTFSIPKEYPCFVYLTVFSFGMEEEQANYLYIEDLVKMLSRCFVGGSK